MHFLFYTKNQIFIESFILSFIITFLIVPLLLRIAKIKGIYSLPNGRSTHLIKTPTLGGIAIFIGFIISTLIFIDIQKIPYMQYVLVSSLILFAIGLRDDVKSLRYHKKFIGQIIAAIIIISFSDIRIKTSYGFLGIGEINNLVGYLISLIFIVGIINAYNLIDGIDGLASGLGIVSTLSFGIWFYLTGNYQLTIITIAMIGALSAFFIYNFFWTKKKIFMGDTGSLILGFFLSIFSIKFLQLNNPNLGTYYIKACPAVIFGILLIPVFDTIRVMTVRIYRGVSPFNADKRHLHHYILEITQSHKKTTVILISANIISIIISFLLRNIRIWQLTAILMLYASVFSYIPFYIAMSRRKRKIQKNKLLSNFVNVKEIKKKNRDYIPRQLEKIFSNKNDSDDEDVYTAN